MKKWAGSIWSGLGWGLGFVIGIAMWHPISEWWDAGHPWFNVTYTLGILTGLGVCVLLGVCLETKEDRRKKAALEKIEAVLARTPGGIGPKKI